uniref:Formin homology 2 domain containing 3 n=1 Tax=Sinocyclocheilus grahami TaxID=75366 RepID=A0A672LJR1_SINGR
MATFACRVQFLDDTDPFNSTNFPEPTRPPHFTFREDIPLINQIAGVHRLLKAPHKLDDCALELSHNGSYLDLESTLAEQRDELEGFQEDGGRGKKHSIILRTQLSVRVHACIEKLYNSTGRELRRALFSLKQIFQDDKDLVHEFVMAEGLTCLIKVGAEADQNYQNYILRALGQIMLYVDGMNGLIGHTETVQWLYTLVGSKFRLVVKTALKLLLVFVEYTETNAPLLIQAVNTVDTKQGCKPWSNAMEILDEKDGMDTELLVYAMTLINKTLAGLPDQDTFYDVVDSLEEQGMEAVAQRHINRKGTDLDLNILLWSLYQDMVSITCKAFSIVIGWKILHHKFILNGLVSSLATWKLGFISGMFTKPIFSPPSGTESETSHPVQAAVAWPSSEPPSASVYALVSPSKPEEQRPVEPSDITLSLSPTNSEPERPETEEKAEEAEAEECEELVVSGMKDEKKEEAEGNFEEETNEMGTEECVREQILERDVDESAVLSEKERQNEELNEKDNCSASSISSASSTLEREEREEKHINCMNTADVNDQCNKVLNSKRFMLDMLYAQNKKAEEDEKEKEMEHLDNQGSVRAVAEKFGDLVKGLVSPHEVEHSAKEKQQAQGKPVPAPSPTPPKKESDHIWDQLMATPRELRIKELDFTDLGEEDDVDILDVGNVIGSSDLTPPPPPPPCLPSLPPPPPLFGCPPPPPIPEPPLFQKKKKTIRLFWNEVRPIDWQYSNHKRCRESLWSKLDPVKLDTAKLENLFETKSKELPKTAADGKRQEIIVLDSKRSNAINIGLTVLPPPRTIKTAILNFDEYALSKEGIEKILTMIPTEEETQKIQEAQLANPDTPLGSAEQFLLILSSISELSARLQLWAFKMDYDALEKEVAEPLQDLKEGMDQLEKNKTLRCILSTLLAIGNFLNGTNAKGFELSYLEKVPEVKDTVHKQSLLHHVCSIVVEKFPESSDLYSEIGAITRSAKVDFDQLQENLCQMERRCKASWDHLKVIAKHEMKPALKQRMSDFLKDCAERIIILKIVHSRIINRAEVGTKIFKPVLSFSCLMFPGHTALLSAANEDTSNCTNDTADEIMERIVKSATQGPSQRTQPRERRRSRANRKSCESAEPHTTMP